MNENAIIKTVPAAAELRKVPTFDPLKYLYKTVSPKTGQPVWKLDLDLKKLWFTLACPNGRMVYNNLLITDQMAMIEARVYLDRGDAEPLANFTATTYASAKPGCYVECAQMEALDEALNNAGFGIQLCDLTASVKSQYGSKIPDSQVEAALGVRHNQSTVTPTPASNQAATATAAVPRITPLQAPEKAPSTARSVNVPMAQEAGEASVYMNPETNGGRNAESVVEQTAVAPSEQVKPQEVQESAVQQTAPPAQHPETVIMDFPVQTVQPDLPADTVPVEEISSASDDPADTMGEPAAEDSQNTEIACDAPPVSYTEDMSVEEICERMTLEQALNCVVEFGTCKGWTVGQVAEQRVSSLKFYLNGHSNASNILKAAATLALTDKGMLQKAG